MALPQLNVYRHERGTRALITFAGETDPATAPQVSKAPAECQSGGIRSMARVVEITGSGFPFHSFPAADARPCRIPVAAGGAL
ncbi:hypothetical protein [Streptomyces sp. NBC_01235]|uniref:hypothetical protein n=1 Tax=Streptomyces sp. NBC_01235 TaxID=2903788 RepID=UPI002E13332C|nr:hypothetical protein OG289_27175 [Streptomyces sp. NBC_01235]